MRGDIPLSGDPPLIVIASGVQVNASFQKIPHLVGRLGLGVWLSASFQIFSGTVISGGDNSRAGGGVITGIRFPNIEAN